MIMKTLRRKTRTDCGHGCAIRSAGEVRASAPIRALVSAIAALLVVALLPSYAFADSSGVIWGPSLLPSQDIGVVVNAPDRYRAAAAALGHTDSEIASWSEDVLAKLSNESTGGAFYTFAQKFGEVDDAVGSDNPITAVISAVGNSFWAIAETLYGNDIWIAGYSAQEFESAARDLASVLSGENIGGGGGSGSTSIPDVLSFTMTDFVSSDSRKLWYQSGDYTTLNATINVNASRVVSDFSTYADSYPYHYYFAWVNGSSLGRGSVTLDVYFSDTECEIRNQDGFYLVGNYKRKQYETSALYVNGVNDVSISYAGTLESASQANMTNALAFNRVVYAISNQSGGGSDPVVPPSNWPDEPSAPSPPELPEPGTNPTVNPTPWSPVLSPTFDFDLNITTDPTSSDLIDWVQKIYYELKAFHTDAHDWANDFGGGFTKVVQAVNSSSSQLYSQLLVIDSSIHDEGLKIRNYMYQMFHWLKEQLDFQNDSFNDSNIVYWLKRIWSKLGSGDINLRPTDPTNDPDDWWDWLVKAIQNFLIGLAATSTELISEIADLASQVMHEFPFSIPWDIAAVLAALSTAPVTPVFTVTVPAISGWWNTFDFVIDLHSFDGAAETIRLMEKLLFTGLLIWKSKELLDFMDVTKWFD